MPCSPMTPDKTGECGCPCSLIFKLILTHTHTLILFVCTTKVCGSTVIVLIMSAKSTTAIMPILNLLPISLQEISFLKTNRTHRIYFPQFASSKSENIRPLGHCVLASFKKNRNISYFSGNNINYCLYLVFQAFHSSAVV